MVTARPGTTSPLPHPLPFQPPRRRLAPPHRTRTPSRHPALPLSRALSSAAAVSLRHAARRTPQPRFLLTALVHPSTVAGGPTPRRIFLIWSAATPTSSPSPSARSRAAARLSAPYCIARASATHDPLPGGKEVAVKQLKAGSWQGEREFQAEVDTISRVHHRHLVSLVGYCIAGAQQLLVYKFVPNQTLEHHLHDKGLPVMEWTTRLCIALSAAKGLAYLHED